MEHTPDGRYVVIDGRRWRATDPALPDDVFTRRDAGLWGHVLRRQGIPLSLLATYPADVRHN